MSIMFLNQQAAEFGTALRRYGRVMLALFRREEEQRRAAPGEALMNLLEPVFLIGFMSLAWWFLDRRNVSPLGGSPALFFATGFYAKFLLIYVSRRMGRAVTTSARRFPIERRLDHVLVHMAIRAVDYMILGVLGFGVIYVFLTPQGLPSNFLPVVQGFLAILALGLGWGILNMVMSQLWWMWDYFFPAFNRVLIIFSGIFYLPEFLAPATREVLSYNPMLHAIILFRQGFYPQYSSILLDTTYLTYCALFSIVAGLVLERVTRRMER
jgi:capsular polysaccharide transport system permease protein